MPTDYQDLAVWRRASAFFVRELARTAARPVIVPMTISSEPYFHEILGGLRRDQQVGHFTLRASREELLRRLALRPTPTPWAVAQLERCLAAFDGRELFREYVETDRLSPEVVAGKVITMLKSPG